MYKCKSESTKTIDPSKFGIVIPGLKFIIIPLEQKQGSFIFKQSCDTAILLFNSLEDKYRFRDALAPKKNFLDLIGFSEVLGEPSAIAMQFRSKFTESFKVISAILDILKEKSLLDSSAPFMITK